ncbi:MAG TPA: glycosyltransferase [Candidatus Anoxymicrobiaceae bacterium]
MKILVFNWRDIAHPEAGGAEVNIHEQARRWAELGSTVTMFTSRPRGRSFAERMDGIDIYRAGGRFGVYLWAALAYLVFLRRKADVILDIENGIPFFTPLYSRKPVVLLMHHLHQDQFLVEMGRHLGRFGRFLERVMVPLLYRNMPVVAVSRSTEDRKREALWRGGDMDMRVVYNGVDHAFYLPSGTPAEKPTVLYLGRIKRYKQLPRLIAMMPGLRAEVPDAELVIAGDGDAMEEVREAVAASPARESIKILGRVTEEEKLELLRRAWVMATPSMNEGWGVTVIEANACGTPAVAFRVAGLDEAIVDGETGVLCEDDAAFTGALAGVLSDESLRERLTLGAMRWASRFDWDETSHQTLELLEQQRARARVRGGRDSGSGTRVLALHWHAPHEVVTSGGLRRTLEIFARAPHGVSIAAVDNEPSAFEGVGGSRVEVLPYRIPGPVRSLESKAFRLERALEWTLAAGAIVLRCAALRARGEQFDVIYVPSSEQIPALLGALVARRLFTAPVVACCTNLDIFPRGARRALAKLHGRVDTLVVISKHLAREFESYGAGSRLVINGVGFDSGEVASPRVKDCEAVFVGRHDTEKGVFDLIEIWRAVTERLPYARLVMIGSCNPTNRKKLDSLISRYGLEANVTIVGVVDDQEKFSTINGSRLCLFPSRVEEWGIVPQEALACGLPVVAYRLPAYEENIKRCDAVFLEDVGDVKGMARRVLELLEGGRLDDYAVMGRGFVGSPGWDEVAAREYEILEGMLRPARTRAG